MLPLGFLLPWAFSVTDSTRNLLKGGYGADLVITRESSISD